MPPCTPDTPTKHYNIGTSQAYLFRGWAGATLGSQIAQQRWGAKDRSEHCQAAEIVAASRCV